jgi:two-component system sensor kinase FixL
LVLLGELASALAHEINQPLTAITGFAAVCARKVADLPEALELVHAIEEQAMRAGEIARRMRGFARRQRLGRGALSLHEVVAGVIRWMSLDTTHLEVISDITGVSADLPPIHADRVELEQVLVNLIRNGLEAARPDTTTQRIAISASLGEHTGELEVRVIDWGRGLPAATHLDAFQPFNSSKEQGLGLGLSICFSIIEGHGGNLWATPNPEGGTIFHFTLPLAAARL